MYQQLNQWLVPQGSSPEETLARLDALTEQYPFFSAAHFLRLKHANPLAESYPQLAQRAALDFPHPILLQLTLAGHDLGTTEAIQPNTQHDSSTPSVAWEVASEPVTETITPPEPALAIEPEAITPSETVEASTEITITHLPSIESMPPLSTEELGTPSQPIPLEFVAEESPVMVDEAAPTTELTPEPVTDATPSVKTAIETKAPMTNNPELDVPLFEPLHTTDYFASLGIKITDQPVSNDQLGQQLRRFTEWLKMMKKLHPSQHGIANTVSPAQEQQVIRQAEASNQEKDVLTEAMAEVLVQQGRIARAIEVYEKLSLNYPAKSAYFAAKISELKG